MCRRVLGILSWMLGMGCSMLHTVSRHGLAMITPAFLLFAKHMQATSFM